MTVTTDLDLDLDSIPWEYKSVRPRRRSGLESDDYMAMHYKGLCYLPMPNFFQPDEKPKGWVVLRSGVGRGLAVKSKASGILVFKFEREESAASFLVRIADLADWSDLDSPEIKSNELRDTLMSIYLEILANEKGVSK